MKRFIAIASLLIILIAGCTFQPAEKTAIDDNLGSSTAGINVLHLTATDGNLPDGTETYIYVDVDKILNDDIKFYVRKDDDDPAADAEAEFIEEVASITISDYECEYQKAFNRIKITGTFQDNGAFTLRFVADNFTSKNGDFLDGNGNGVKEGSPYDDVYFRFYTGTGAGDRPDLTHPEIERYDPKEGNTSNLPTIKIWFSEPMDTLSIINNVKLYDNSGIEQTLTYDNYNNGDSTIEFTTDTLDQLKKYWVKINCAGIKDEENNRLIPYNEDYTPNMSDTFSYYFVTEADVATTDDDPLRVNGNPSKTSDYLEINFNDSLNTTLLENINDYITVMYTDTVVYTDASGWVIEIDTSAYMNLSGEIVMKDNHRGLLFSLMNLPDNYCDIKLFVSKDLEDKSGWKLDDNGNDIGGESYDPLRDPKKSDNYTYDNF